jgi:hypothetical protein
VDLLLGALAALGFCQPDGTPPARTRSVSTARLDDVGLLGLGPDRTAGSPQRMADHQDHGLHAELLFADDHLGRDDLEPVHADKAYIRPSRCPR